MQFRCLRDTAEDYTMPRTSLSILHSLDQSNAEKRVWMKSPIFIGRENPKCSDSHQPAFYSLMANRKPSSISPLSVHCKLWTKRSKCARNCGINSATFSNGIFAKTFIRRPKTGSIQPTRHFFRISPHWIGGSKMNSNRRSKTSLLQQRHLIITLIYLSF